MQRHRFATREELIQLLGEDDDERAVLNIVLDRLANHGVDVNALVKVSIDLIDMIEKAGSAKFAITREEAR